MPSRTKTTKNCPPIAAAESQTPWITTAAQHQRDPASQSPRLRHRAERVDQPGAEQRRVERVRGDPGQRAQDERAEHGVGLVGAELGGRGVLAVQEILQHLEAEADVGADHQAVGDRADHDRGEPHQQQEADRLGGLLDERRGQPGLPVLRPRLPEQLGVERHHRGVAGDRDRERRAEAADQERRQGEVARGALPAVGVVQEAQEDRREGGPRQQRGRVGLRVGGSRRLDGVEDEPQPGAEQREIDPEARVVRLDEVKARAPARAGDRLPAPLERIGAHDPLRRLAIIAAMSSDVAVELLGRADGLDLQALPVVDERRDQPGRAAGGEGLHHARRRRPRSGSTAWPP